MNTRKRTRQNIPDETLNSSVNSDHSPNKTMKTEDAIDSNVSGKFRFHHKFRMIEFES